jgi:adenosylhomocysteine nucleosidase
MRLHRTITPDRPLLVVALEEEAVHIHVSDLPVLVTGVGKVNAAVAVSTILGEHSPSRIVNLGTAGALHDGLAGTYIVRSVIQHDLDDAVLFDVTGLHVSETIDVADEGLRLATGDAFITDARIREKLARTADLVDMEGYAVARAAMVAGVPVTIVKEVSDSADGSAGRSWRDSVDICAERLGAWVRGNLLG